MIRVRIEAAQEGMVLARTVVDGAGGALVREGAILTRAVIDKMKEVGGIDEIFVDPPPLSDQEKGARRQEIESRARRMFAGHESDPVMQALARVSVEILTRRA